MSGIVAVAAVASAGMFGASTDAQTAPADPVVTVVSVDPDTGGPVGVEHRGPAVSDDGSVVVFEVDLESSAAVFVADRAGGDTVPIAVDAAAPGVSGDGCVVVYSTLLEADPTNGAGPIAPSVELSAVDRCAAAPGAVVVDTIPAPGRFAPPALSADGSTIVWSTGSEIRRYVRPSGGQQWALTDRFDSTSDPSDPTIIESDAIVTGRRVDLSADGTAVAFEAGPGGAAFAPDPANVYVWVAPASPADPPTVELVSITAQGEPGTASSGSPSLSADGTVVVFESASADLAATGGAAVAAPFVVMVDRGNGGTRVLVPAAGSPSISADGRHVVTAAASGLVVTTWVSGPPFETTTQRSVTAVPGTDVAGISQHGRWVVFPSDRGVELTTDDRFASGEHVWAADLRPSGDGSVVDTTTTTTTTIGPTTTRPTTTGPTTTAPDGPGTDSTTTTPTTTVGGSGGIEAPVASTLPPQSTIPIGTVPPDFSFPVVRLPPRNSLPSLVSPPPTFPAAGSTPGTTARTALLTFDVSAQTFEPTVIDAGRRTASVALRNQGTAPATITALRIDPAADGGPFAVLGENCTTSSLGAGSACVVELQFAPTAVGEVSSALVAETDDGDTVALALAGTGAAAPVLDVLPAVAAPGQVVTVLGSGFPAGSTVDLSWGFITETFSADSPTTPPVDAVAAVDPDGTFAMVLVVLPNTMAGPMPISVAGQLDVFADVGAELLVSGSSGGSDSALRSSVGIRR